MSDIVAGLGSVRGIDSGGNTTTKDGTIISHEPFGRVESQDVDDAEGGNVEMDQGLREGAALGVVARPGPDWWLVKSELVEVGDQGDSFAK